jgi:hypothetical protein
MVVKLIAGAALAALALTFGIFYGAGAVAVLAFLVLWSGLVVAFLVAWGDIARRGGSWYYRRQSGEH